MSNLVKKESIPELLPEERALLLNDLSRLGPEQRADLYARVCRSIGINPLTQPFQYLQLGGKLVFYATRNCTDQLRSLHSVSVVIQSREKVDDLYVVTARATLSTGRTDESIAAVQLKGLNGDALANAIMKCETKAKRRVTLSICGLSFMDETEAETIRDAKIVDVNQAHFPPSPPPDSHPPIDPQQFPPDGPQQAPVDDIDRVLGIAGPGTFIIPVGRTTTGKRIDEIPESTLREIHKWTKDQLTLTPPVKNASQLFNTMVNIKEFLRSMDCDVSGL